MEKKDWKERFRDLDFLVKIKDSFGWTNEIDYEVLENFFEQEIDRAKIELLEKIVDKKGYTDEMIINRMEREYLYLTKPIIINNPIKLEDEDKEIEIPFSMEDLEDLQHGEEFNWTFDGIDVHLYNEEVDLL